MLLWGNTVVDKPFLVLSLPRSRSAWLSVLLGCAHDPIAEYRSPKETLDEIAKGRSAIDTALASWPDEVLAHRHRIRMAFLLRPQTECWESFRRVARHDERTSQKVFMATYRGFQKLREEMPDAPRLRWDQLDDPEAVREFWAALHKGGEFPVATYFHLRRMNIQRDLDRMQEEFA